MYSPAAARTSLVCQLMAMVRRGGAWQQSMPVRHHTCTLLQPLPSYPLHPLRGQEWPGGAPRGAPSPMGPNPKAWARLRRWIRFRAQGFRALTMMLHGGARPWPRRWSGMMASQPCCRLCQARGDGKTRVVADVMMVLGPRGHSPWCCSYGCCLCLSMGCCYRLALSRHYSKLEGEPSLQHTDTPSPLNV